LSIFITVLIFGLIITVHEVGHFAAARAGGIAVLEFAIGMGPKIFSVERNGTVYSLRLIPIGGFCKMLGEDNTDDDPRAFCNKSVLRRVCVVSGGSAMNFLLAFAAFFAIILVSGMYVPEMRELIPGMPAAEAGFLPGDRIIKLNGKRINIYDDFGFVMADNGARPVEITVKRGGAALTKIITPVYDAESGGYKVGFRPEARLGVFGGAEPGFNRVGLFEALAAAFYNIAFWIKYTFLSLVRLFTLKLSVDELAGPIGIAQTINETYSETVAYGITATVATMANIMALISANLGVFNLLPLPALDGGRLVFLAVEGVRRKPLAQEREGMVHFIGFVALMLLAVFVAYNDIRRFM